MYLGLIVKARLIAKFTTMNNSQLDLALIRSAEFRSIAGRKEKETFLEEYKKKYHQATEESRLGWLGKAGLVGLIDGKELVSECKVQGVTESKEVDILQQLTGELLLHGEVQKMAKQFVEGKIASQYHSCQGKIEGQQQRFLNVKSKELEKQFQEDFATKMSGLFSGLDFKLVGKYFEKISWESLQHLLKTISVMKTAMTSSIPPVFRVLHFDKGIKGIDIRQTPRAYSNEWERVSAYQDRYAKHLDDCLQEAEDNEIIKYGESTNLMVSHDSNPDMYLGSTIAMLNPFTAQEIGIDIESFELQYVEVNLPPIASNQYNKCYFSIICNEEVAPGAILVPQQWQHKLMVGTEVEISYLEKLPNPISLFVHHEHLGTEYNSSLVPEGENINVAISLDEFRMPKTTLTVGDTFFVMGAGQFSITKIWAENPSGGQPFELPAAGFMADMDVEILFKRVAKI